MGVKTAYLNGNLSEEIYMEQPKGFVQEVGDEKNLVCFLNRSLYGLKESGRQWNHCLNDYLKSVNLKPAKSDHVFIQEEKVMIAV